jgi:hypothetical protein
MVDQKKAVNAAPPSQVDLLKVELKDRDKKIAELEEKLEIAGHPAVAPGYVAVNAKALGRIFFMMWTRKLMHLDKRFAYKWIMELFECTEQEAAAQMREWANVAG